MSIKHVPVPGRPLRECGSRLWLRKLPDRMSLQVGLWAGLLAALLLGRLSFWLAAALLPFGLAAFMFASRIGYKVWVGWPLAMAGLLGIQYVLSTSPSVRQHDVEGHREYVDFLIEHGKIPPVLEGWETWQPPLYYLIAAGWRQLLSGIPQDDPFRSTQFFAALLYIATVACALLAFRRSGLGDVEAVSAAGLLACIPGYVFFAARISNDVLLPLLGTGILVLTAGIVEKSSTTNNPDVGSTDGRPLVYLALVLVACLATKGSSLAIVAGALGLVFWSNLRRLGWEAALMRTYLVGLPSGLWLLFWFIRNAVQTGDPLYVNAALPEELRVLVPTLQRLLSFKAGAFLGGRFYYDEPIRGSYFTALFTSILYGEYNMGGYSFHFSGLLRFGCLGVIGVLLIGAVVPPGRESRAVWLTCVCLAACHSAITVAYAVNFPYACNQNMRFLAQAFVPFAGLFGLGVGHLRARSRLTNCGGLIVVALVFTTGAVDFYLRLLF